MAAVASIRVTLFIKRPTSAITELKASKEHYNPAVLAGMANFVKSVEEELSRFLESSTETANVDVAG